MILKPSKVNQILKEAESPIMLKAGRISLVNVHVSAWNLFSDSFALNVEDVHLIFGPSSSLLDNTEDYRDDIKADYNFENMLANISAMHNLH